MNTLRNIVMSVLDGKPEHDGSNGFVKLPIGKGEYVLLSPSTVEDIVALAQTTTM